MSATVIKLGSSITADAGGDLRDEVLARICDEVARLEQPVVVTSGAIARGIRVLGLPLRPTAIADLQAASAVGQGRLFPVYDELLRERGRQAAQVLLTFHDMRERTALPQRAQIACAAARVARCAGHQRERHDRHRRDLLRRQRLPRRAVAVLLGARGSSCSPTPTACTPPTRTRPVGGAIDEIRHPPSSRRCRSATRPPRSARAACARRWCRRDGHRRRHPDDDLQRPRARRARPRACAARPRARASIPRPSGPRRSSCGCATPSPRTARRRRRGRGAGAARAAGRRCCPVGVTEVLGGFGAGDAVEVLVDGAVDRQGHRELLGRRAAPRAGQRGAEVREELGSDGDEAVHRDYFVLSRSLRPWPSRPPPSPTLPAGPAASRRLAQLDRGAKDAALLAIADALERERRRSSRPTRATWRPAARPR
jgi:glutamate 5-kinase